MITSKRGLLAIVVLAIASLPLSGCGIVGMFDTRQYMDRKVDENGRSWVLDTPKNFQNWKMVIDGHIQREAQGLENKGGGGTWPNFWKSIFKAVKQSSVNPERKIDYIITTRRARGLPEL